MPYHAKAPMLQHACHTMDGMIPLNVTLVLWHDININASHYSYTVKFDSGILKQISKFSLHANLNVSHMNPILSICSQVIRLMYNKSN